MKRGGVQRAKVGLPNSSKLTVGALLDNSTRSTSASTIANVAITAGVVVCCFGTLGIAADSRIEGYVLEEAEGWTVYVQEALLEQEPEDTDKALVLLSEQARKVIEVIPAKIVRELQTVSLWLSLPHEGRRPRAEFHLDKGWLIEKGMIPDKEKCIDYTNTGILDREVIRMPILLLHELSHAYHNLVLGFEQPDILHLYQKAKENGSYDLVERKNRESQMSYAMSNRKEYFAECTEAFFGENDFYPFNNDELKQRDPAMHALLEQLWSE